MLQAVWALLLYRAGGEAGAAPVRFSTTVSGRGIGLEGVERLPGALSGPQPLSVRVDPRATVPALLAELRDRALDMAGYEWVSAGQIHAWTGQPPTAGSLLTFETHPPLGTTLESELAALGIRVEPVPPPAGHRGFPLALTAHHDAARRLVMTASYSRAPLAAAETLARHTRSAPARTSRTGRGSPPPSPRFSSCFPTPALHPAPCRRETGSSTHTPAAGPALVVLRRARHPGAGTVALLQAPGRPEVFHDRLAHAYPGPEELVLLAPASGGPACLGDRPRRTDPGRQPPRPGRPVRAGNRRLRDRPPGRRARGTAPCRDPDRRHRRHRRHRPARPQPPHRHPTTASDPPPPARPGAFGGRAHEWESRRPRVPGAIVGTCPRRRRSSARHDSSPWPGRRPCGCPAPARRTATRER